MERGGQGRRSALDPRTHQSDAQPDGPENERPISVEMRRSMIGATLARGALDCLP
jgi:hypothetical protein